MHSGQLGPDTSFGLAAHGLGMAIVLLALVTALLYPAYSWVHAVSVRARLRWSTTALHDRVKGYPALVDALGAIAEPADLRRLVYDVTHRPGRVRATLVACVSVGTALGGGGALAIAAERLRWGGEGYVVGVLVLPWVGAVVGEMTAIAACTVQDKMSAEPLPRASAPVAALLARGERSGYALRRHRAEVCNRVERSFVRAGIPVEGLDYRRLTAVGSDAQWVELQGWAARRLVQAYRGDFVNSELVEAQAVDWPTRWRNVLAVITSVATIAGALSALVSQWIAGLH